MKNVFAIIFFLFYNFSSYSQENNIVPNGVITGDFTIKFVDKDIVLTPDKPFSIDNLQLTEYNRSPRSWKKIGRQHILPNIIAGGYFGIGCIISLLSSSSLLVSLSPLFLEMAAIEINNATIKATRVHMNKVSYKIILTKPDGRKYNGKIAFFKVHNKCSKLEVGEIYHISMANERLEKLDNNTYTDIAEYEYCSKHRRATWVIWDLTKAN